MLKGEPTGLLPHNSRQSLQGRFNSWIETLKHAKPERSGHGNISNRGWRAGNGVESVPGAAVRNELCETSTP